MEEQEFTARWKKGDHVQGGILLLLACVAAFFCPVSVSNGAPANDEFANRIVLDGLPSQTSGSTIDATRDSSEPPYFVDANNGFLSSQPVWWSWTSPTNGAVTVVVTMPKTRPLIGVFTGDDPASLVQVSTLSFNPAVTDGGTNYFPSEARFTAIEGTTYAIAVDSQFPVTLAWDPNPDPTVAGYKVYYGPTPQSYTNVLDVGLPPDLDPLPPEGGTNPISTVIFGLINGATYHFAVTAYNADGLEGDFSEDQRYSVPVSSASGGEDFRLAITSSPYVSILNPAADADFPSPTDITLQVTGSGGVSQVEYSYRSDSIDQLIGVATSDPFDLLWSNVSTGRYLVTARATDIVGATALSSVAFTVGRPQNDDFTNSINLTGIHVTTTGTTLGAGRESGEPASLSPSTVWWTWTAPASGTNIVVVSTRSEVAKVRVFTGTTVSNLTLVSTSVPAESSFSNGVFTYFSGARVVTVAGTRYSIAVDVANQPFTLAITVPPSVRITSPATGTNAIPGSNILLKVTTSDIDGFIKRVEYWATNANTGAPFLIGTATATPFSFTWNAIPAGSYVIAAKAVDDLGARTLSAPIRITSGHPSNDLFQNAVSLGNGPALTEGSNVGAGKEVNEPEKFGDYSTYSTVWWNWIAPADASNSVVVTMAGAVPVIGIFRGVSASLLELSEVGVIDPVRMTESNGISYFTVEARFDTTVGRKFSFAVDGRYHATAPFTLAVTASPTVQLTNLLSGTNFLAGMDIVLQVAADDPDGFISKVEYWCDSDAYGSELIGVATTPPFDLLWSTAKSARCMISARAFDDLGATADSDPVPITVGRPANDNFEDRIPIINWPAMASASTIAAGRESGEPKIFDDDQPRFSVWWSWTAPSNDSYSVVVTMPSSTPLVGVFTGDSFSSLSEVSTLDFAEPIQINDTIYLRSKARFNAIAGTEYAIAVDTADGPGGPFDLVIDVAPHVAITNPPAGANFAAGNAISLEVETSEPGEVIAEVDYYYDDGFRGPRLLAIATNSPFSAVAPNLPFGRYLLSAQAVDETGASSLSSSVLVTVGRPPNDDFANPAALTGFPLATNGTTAAAGTEPAENLAGFPLHRTVWYNWTAPDDGPVSVIVTSPNYHPLAGVFVGTSLSDLAIVSTLALTDSSSTNGVGYFRSEARFQAKKHSDYAIAVDSVGQDFTLVITPTPGLQLLNPTAGTEFLTGSDIFLDVTTTNLDTPGALVEYFVGDGFDDPFRLGDVAGPSFSLTWSNVPAGSYVLSAKGIDPSGAIAWSAPQSITVGRPENDAFAKRTVLAGSPVSFGGANIAASLEPGERLEIAGQQISHTVWWNWTATTTGPYVVLARARDYRPLVAVYTGNTVSNLVTVSDFLALVPAITNNTFFFTSEASFSAVAGASYSVAVDLQDGVQTNFDLIITAVPTVRITNPITGTNFPVGASVDLQIETTDTDGTIVQADFQTDYCTGTSTTPPFELHCNNLSPGSYTLTATVTDDSGATATSDPVTFTVGRPSNDDFANRIELDGALLTTNAVTSVASREPGEPYHAGYIGDHSVWWSWTPPVSGNYTLSTEGSTCDTLLAVYLGSSISNLIPVASDTGSGSNFTSLLSFDAFSTNTYQIAVDGRYDANGEIALSIVPTPISIRIEGADTGIFLVHFSSGEGQQAIMEGSDDLIQWVPICTNTITGGTILFSDLHGTELAHRFYRAIIAFEPTAVKIDLESAANEQVQLQTTGGEGALVVIEATETIDQWVPVGTNRIIDGRVTFSETPGTNWPHRFFRVSRSR